MSSSYNCTSILLLTIVMYHLVIYWRLLNGPSTGVKDQSASLWSVRLVIVSLFLYLTWNMTEALGIFYAIYYNHNSTWHSLCLGCSVHLFPAREFPMENIREGFLKFKHLLVLFITGIQYAAAWSDYMSFVYNQTVSTLFLAIGVAGFINNVYSF